MGDTIPTQVSLGCVRELTEHGSASEPDSESQATLLYGSCLPVFWPSLTSVMEPDLEEAEMNLFLPTLLLIRVWHLNNRDETITVLYGLVT